MLPPIAAPGVGGAEGCPGEGGAVTASHNGMMSLQVNDKVCDLQNGCCFTLLKGKVRRIEYVESVFEHVSVLIRQWLGTLCQQEPGKDIRKY